MSLEAFKIKIYVAIGWQKTKRLIHRWKYRKVAIVFWNTFAIQLVYTGEYRIKLTFYDFFIKLNAESQQTCIYGTHMGYI
jgi:hypothetical protein